MYKEFNSGFFDIMLAKALYEDMELEQANAPSESEVRELFPYTHKQEREARRLRRILKHGNERPAFIYIKRTAVILLCTVTLSFGLLMTDDGIRAAVGDTLKKTAEKLFSLSYQADMDDVIKEIDGDKGYYEITFDDVKVEDRETAEKKFDIDNIQITYIPEGYEMCENVQDENRMFYVYKNSNGSLILINISLTETIDQFVNFSNKAHEKINVNGNDAFVFYDTDEYYGEIIWGNELFTMEIFGYTSIEQLLKIAEGVKF